MTTFHGHMAAQAHGRQQLPIGEGMFMKQIVIF